MFFRTIPEGKRLSKLNLAILLCVLTILFVSVLSACTATKGNILILEDGHGTGFTMTLMDYSSDNKCELSLNKGEMLQIEVDRDDGKISFAVSGKNGSEPYEGNDIQSGMFTLTVSETDIYVFRVKGNDATGKITVRNLGPEME